MLGPIDYETQVGLWLNRTRQETRRAAGVLKAISAAISDKVGPEWFAAMTDDEDTGKAMHEMHASEE